MKCAHCGVAFERAPKRKHAKYCSRPCAYKAARANFNMQKFKQDPVRR